MSSAYPTVGGVVLKHTVNEQSSVPVRFNPGRGVFIAELGGKSFEESSYVVLENALQAFALKRHEDTAWRPFYAVSVTPDGHIVVNGRWLSPDMAYIKAVDMDYGMSFDEPTSDAKVVLEEMLYSSEVLFLRTPATQAALVAKTRQALTFARGLESLKKDQKGVLRPLLSLLSTDQKMLVEESEVLGVLDLDWTLKVDLQKIVPEASQLVPEESRDDALQMLQSTASEPELFTDAIEILRRIVLRASLHQAPPNRFEVVTDSDVSSIRALLEKIGVNPFEGFEAPVEEDQSELTRKIGHKWSDDISDMADVLVDGQDGVDRINKSKP